MIKQLLFEMKYEIVKNLILMGFLKSIVIYYLSSIIFSLMDFTFLISFIVASTYFIIDFIYNIQKVNIKIFEEHNPHMQQMITTAADNMNRDNIVIQELFKDVLQNAQKLSSGTLVEPRQLLLIILLIPILAVAHYEMTPLRIDAISQDAMLDQINSWGITGLLKGARLGELNTTEFLDEDIYGDSRITNLGNQEINLKMNLGYETDFTRPTNEDIDDLAFKDYPDEGGGEDGATDAETNSENIVETDLAQKYNEQIRNMK